MPDKNIRKDLKRRNKTFNYGHILKLQLKNQERHVNQF